MFASVSLAARIERAECRLLSDSAFAASRRRPGADVFAVPIAGGVATYTGPGSPLNKVAGLGFGGAIDPAELVSIERAFVERGAAVQFEVSTLGDPSIVRFLSERGYALVGFENVSALALSGRRAAPQGAVRVSESPAVEMSAWVDVVVTGVASPDVGGVPSHESFPREPVAQVVADMASAEGVSRYLAWLDGAVVGGASLRVFEGVATLCGAATRPEHRRRGVQTALLGARLDVAAAAGCDVAVVTTQPGSKSQENVQRQGFDLLYARAVMVRGPDAG